MVSFHMKYKTHNNLNSKTILKPDLKAHTNISVFRTYSLCFNIHTYERRVRNGNDKCASNEKSVVMSVEVEAPI